MLRISDIHWYAGDSPVDATYSGHCGKHHSDRSMSGTREKVKNQLIEVSEWRPRQNKEQFYPNKTLRVYCITSSFIMLPRFENSIRVFGAAISNCVYFRGRLEEKAKLAQCAQQSQTVVPASPSSKTLYGTNLALHGVLFASLGWESSV